MAAGAGLHPHRLDVSGAGGAALGRQPPGAAARGKLEAAAARAVAPALVCRAMPAGLPCRRRREEVADVYNTPLLDLVYTAASVHRMYNDPAMVSRRRRHALLLVRPRCCIPTCHCTTCMFADASCMRMHGGSRRMGRRHAAEGQEATVALLWP